MTSILSNLRKELKKNSDKKTREVSKRFFKENEKIKTYGVRSAVVVKIGKEYFKKIKDKDKKEIFSLCELLWQSEYMEESFIACNWSYYLNKEYKPADFKIFERWVNTYVGNWAECDTLCNHTIGTFLAMYPGYTARLKKWAKSKNRWTRRAAAVSFIVPARNGLFLKEVLEIADILLLDDDDLVQKGYGWMLKVAANKHEKVIFDYVMSKKEIMPRTALRYAIEKMPRQLRVKAMS